MRLVGGFRLALVLLCLGGALQSAEAQFKFAYTGGLFGYFRDDVAPPEATLIANLNRHGYALRLAMGGNYSPEFGASIQLQEARSALNPEETYPECHLEPVHRNSPLQVRDFYKDDGHIAPYGYCDNVTRFFMKAGYRAIVPSEQDFIYGSGWLVRTALQMREPSSQRFIANDDHQMNMLSANIRMTLTLKLPNGHEETICPLLFAEVSDWQHARPCGIPPDLEDDEPSEGIGYVSTSLGGRKTWIIGVAGQEVLNATSQSKRTVCINTSAAGTPRMKAEIVSCATRHNTTGELFLGDPANGVIRMMRKMRTAGMQLSDNVVVMAQMSREDATALAVRLHRRFEAMPDGDTYPPITAILSRADNEQYTPTVDQSYHGVLDRAMTLTPRLAYETDFDPRTPDRLVEPESYANFLPSASGSDLFRMVNESPGGPLGVNNKQTALHLLYAEVSKHTGNKVQTCADEKKFDTCSLEMTQFLLKTLMNTGSGSADVALMEHGDFFMGMLPEGFTGYEMCAQMALPEDRCRLWVALDRVFWRGDFTERFAVKGETLLSALARSENFSKSSNDAVGASLGNDWLESFGIMRATIRNKPQPTQVNNAFSPPENLVCAGTDTNDNTGFCINGKTIDKERSYWVVASDDLADDTAVYSEFGAVQPHLREKGDVHLSEALANKIFPETNAAPLQGLENVATLGEADTNFAQIAQQQKKHFRLDFGKAIVGYTQAGSIHEGGDDYSARFQGVGDSRASQASQRTNDFELQMRTSVQLGHVFFNRATRIEAGTDTVIEYARMATGKLDGTPATPSYSKNTLSTTPFIQFIDPVPSQTNSGFALFRHISNLGFMRIASSGDILSVALERQLIAPPLFLNYPITNNPDGVNALRIDKNWGVKPRAGLRLESSEPHHWFQTDRSSFLEAGVQYSRTFIC